MCCPKVSFADVPGVFDIVTNTGDVAALTFIDGIVETLQVDYEGEVATGNYDTEKPGKSGKGKMFMGWAANKGRFLIIMGSSPNSTIGGTGIIFSGITPVSIFIFSGLKRQ